jgi:hypothetical protein
MLRFPDNVAVALVKTTRSGDLPLFEQMLPEHPGLAWARIVDIARWQADVSARLSGTKRRCHSSYKGRLQDD